MERLIHYLIVKEIAFSPSSLFVSFFSLSSNNCIVCIWRMVIVDRWISMYNSQNSNSGGRVIVSGIMHAKPVAGHMTTGRSGDSIMKDPTLGIRKPNESDGRLLHFSVRRSVKGSNSMK